MNQFANLQFINSSNEISSEQKQAISDFLTNLKNGYALDAYITFTDDMQNAEETASTRQIEAGETALAAMEIMFYSNSSNIPFGGPIGPNVQMSPCAMYYAGMALTVGLYFASVNPIGALPVLLP